MILYFAKIQLAINRSIYENRQIQHLMYLPVLFHIACCKGLAYSSCDKTSILAQSFGGAPYILG